MADDDMAIAEDPEPTPDGGWYRSLRDPRPPAAATDREPEAPEPDPPLTERPGVPAGRR